ncbi:hypothetical protein V6N13_143700 [Hibiscus sabdariffa]
MGTRPGMISSLLRSEQSTMFIRVLAESLLNSESSYFNGALTDCNILNLITAHKLIKEEEVEVIVGLETWEEAVLVGDIGSRAQVPVLSFAAPAITPPLATTRWPFLVTLAKKDSQQMKCIVAIVGDITILASRAEQVEFTQPYAESGLSMLVPAKSEDSAWFFLKPFTKEMWLVTTAILIYTTFIVWMLEHQSNPEFRGPWNNQIGTALWFTFSSLFFAHREKIYSNLTRVVVVVWLFIILVLNSSNTASSTSMLTLRRLGPNTTDMESLKRADLKIGCDGDSFVRAYLEQLLHFESCNIENVSSECKYGGEFKSNSIAAAFLELPCGEVFLTRYCKQFTTSTPTYRFGGLGFVGA